MFSLPFECEFCLLKLASTPNFIGTESENHFFFYHLGVVLSCFSYGFNYRLHLEKQCCL